MKKSIIMTACAVSLLLPFFAWASEWRVTIPPFGEASLGAVQAQTIPYPFKRGESVCGGDEKKRKECEEAFSKEWLRITPVHPPRIIIVVKDISSPSSYVPDYSLYTSWPGPRGGTLIVGEKQISFSYYTINADATESENIERFRGWLDAMARQKKKIRLSGVIARIETSDLALLDKDKTETEFLDFYLSDIQFEK